MGGEIRKNGKGPYRLYNPERKPGSGGLAVSRGFGDLSLRKMGLIYEPDVTKFKIDGQTDFVVMGSDGFFEFFSVDEVVSCTYELLKKSPPGNIAEELVEEARKRWRGYAETDDISCVVVIF